MIRNFPNISDFWGKLVFTAMFSFLIFAFEGQSYQNEKNDITVEMVNEVQLHNSNALTTNLIQVPSFQKDILTDRERNFISQNNNAHKILTDNHKTHQALLSLQKSRLIVKPQLIVTFYYHLFSGKSKDYPDLS